MFTTPPAALTRFFLAHILMIIVNKHISYDKAFKLVIKKQRITGWVVPLLYQIGYHVVNNYYGLRWLAAKEGYGLKPPAIAAYFTSIGFSIKTAKRLLKEEVKGMPHYRRLALLYSYPEYVVRDLLRYLRPREVEAILKSLNQRKRWLRVNTLKTDLDKAYKCLEDSGVIFQVYEDLDYMVFVEHPKWKPLGRNKCVRKGYIVPQDLASVFVVEALGIREDSTVLDACSAPGLKLSLAYMLTRNKLYSLAVDISRKRQNASIKLFRRLGVNKYRVVHIVGDSAVNSFNRVFDYAIVDAPCTGLGAVYSDPAVKIAAWRRSKLEYYHEKQYSILRNTLRYARKVVYATCSIHPYEGEHVVEKIIDEGLAEPVEPAIELEPAYPNTRVHRRTWRVYPQIYDSQGFYIAILESRVAGK